MLGLCFCQLACVRFAGLLPARHAQHSTQLCTNYNCPPAHPTTLRLSALPGYGTGAWGCGQRGAAPCQRLCFQVGQSRVYSNVGLSPSVTKRRNDTTQTCLVCCCCCKQLVCCCKSTNATQTCSISAVFAAGPRTRPCKTPSPWTCTGSTWKRRWPPWSGEWCGGCCISQSAWS